MNNLFSLQDWQIHSDDTQLSARINKVLTALPSHRFIDTLPYQLEQQLKQHIADIDSLTLRRELPNKLIVQASIRVPIALWSWDHALWLVDSSGKPYRKQGSDDHFDIPLLHCNKQQLAFHSLWLKHLRSENILLYQDLSESFSKRDSLRLIFNKHQRWLLPMTNTLQTITKLNKLLSKDPWLRHHWRIDARIPERWFFQKALGTEVS